MYYESHPTLDALELHLLRRLTEEEQRELKDHLYGCNRCHVMAYRLQHEIELIHATLALDSGC